MAEVYEIEVEYKRKVAPRDYEEVYGRSTIKATIKADEDSTEVLDGLFAGLVKQIDTHVFDAAGRRSAPATAPAQPAQPAQPAKPAKPAQPPREPAKPAQPAEPPQEPEKPADEPLEITDQELMKVASAEAERATREAVKGVMKEFRVARLGEIEQERRREFLDKLAELPDAQ